MADTIAELAGLLKLGPDAPLQPPRFAKVVSVAGDTVTVTLGGSNVDAVRCCDCSADDVVLLETMPSGQLAAVATKGASGGGGGVQSVTIGTVSGATFTDTGTATDPVLNLTVPIYSTLTVTENSGGVQLSSYGLELGTGAWPAGGGWGWREEKWSDGRLTVYWWQWFATTGSGWQQLWTNLPYPTGATGFVDTPNPSVSLFDNGASVQGAAMVKLTSIRTSSDTTGFKMTYYNSAANTNAKTLVLVRADGHWS